MITFKFPAILLASMLFTACPLSAQETSDKPITENELRACLQLEQQGMARFKKLEGLAEELRGSQQLLNERRAILQSQKTGLGNRDKADAGAATQFNESVNEFNHQVDRLNNDKNRFESDSLAYQQWMRSTLQPACGPLANRTVSPVTLYYACGFNGTQALLAEVPHCKTLPKLDSLKNCILNAGSKTEAQAVCNG